MVNKYARFSRTDKPYNAEDKRYRLLPVTGPPGKVLPQGTQVMFHGRLYRTRNAISVPPGGGVDKQGRPVLFADCELVRYIEAKRTRRK